MSNKIYKTGIYAWLSNEDADSAMSNSIQSQRAICLAYIESHDDLDLVDIYIDDGNYLEKIFSAVGIRYIAINDNYDGHAAGSVESPERHKRRVGTRSGDNIQGEGWCPSTIRGILQNQAYIVELICGKSETVLYKGLKKRVMEKDNWIIIPDAHLPIVPAADF